MIYRGAILALALLSATHALLLAPGAAPRAPVATPALRRGGLDAVRAVVPEAGGADLHTLLTTADAAGRALTDEQIRFASGDIGWWGTYIKTVEDGIFTLHDFLSSKGVPYPYAFSIASFVLGVKAVTFPLNWQQLSSSSSMKALKPQQDIVRKWYGDNKEMLNIQIGNLFDDNDVNPLAGCLPSLAQIPVFLGVYYSVTSIARNKVFDEGFLWIPNLSGPIADRREGLSWLTEGWIDGVPKLGWHDTLCYLVMPLILICTQTAALYLLGSFEAIENSEDSTSQNAGIVLRLLPFMLGWFAMNAPAGLGLYWVSNNILTTVQTLTIKKLTEKPELNVEVDLAVLGPRRAPVPLPEGNSAPDWVKKPEPPPEALEAGAEAGEGAAVVDVAAEEPAREAELVQ